MDIILDTNFIITCLNQKIDFVNLANELFDKEINWVLPLEVKQELEKISQTKLKDSRTAALALQFLKQVKIREIILHNKNTDNGLVNYLKTDNKAVLATLDNGLKKRVTNRILRVKGKKMLEIL
ncbi:MAG: hypothetical protein Q7S33_04600 [Nanoarchaeota archaeon]|nr:hypothetical protein [Nanoarchaeota archaeon]